MIKSFKSKETEKVFQRFFSRQLPQNIQKTAYRRLAILHSAKELKDLLLPPSNRLEKLVLSAIANWQAKNEDAKIEDADLFVKEIRVDGGTMLKRLRPAPQGRAHRIRKRSNHVTVVIGSLNNTQS